MKKVMMLGLGLGFATATFGAVTNVTAALELLGNPTTERWTSACKARSVMDLQVYDNKVYMGTGDWDLNAGPIPVWAYDPEKHAFTNEFEAGTDSIETIRVLADGCMYIPAIDPREGHVNNGMLFRKEKSGAWTVFPKYLDTMTMHVFDIEMLGDRRFLCGYGIGSSTNEVDWTDVGDTYCSNSRQYTLIRCGNDLFCRTQPCVYFKGHADDSPMSLSYSYANNTMWRWVESVGQFQEFNNPWTNVAPGLVYKDAFLEHGKGDTTEPAVARSWHATPFGNRNLSVLGDSYKGRTFDGVENVNSGTRPMIAVSAYGADDGKGGRTMKCDRIALPSGYYPIDFCVNGGTAYMLAFAYNEADENVRHGVWKTTDGVNFEQILTFDYQQVMLSLEYLEGYFYFGVGHKSAMVALGTLKAGTADTAGSVYRVFLPQNCENGKTPFIPYYRKLLNVDAMRALGITGRGVRVGVVDGPISEVSLSNGRKDLKIAKRAGASGGNGHGVSVSSIVASYTFGIAPDCELYVYDVGSTSGATQVNNTLKGVWWCATNGCKVINMSFSFNPFQPGVMELRESFDAELRRIKEQTGVILINSLGNNETNDNPYFPQDTDLCICIGGITEDLQPANVTKGWRHDFCAFGQHVPTFTKGDGSASYQDGTSFSAPMATGLAALLLQQNPDLTQDEIYGIFKDSCKKLAPGKTREYGWGLLQASIVQKDYKRQAEYDAERAAKIKLQSITINNPNIFYNSEAGLFDVTLKVGTAIHLDYTPNPANATDKRVYWYTGRTDLLEPILEDDMLWVRDDKSLVGTFACYTAKNDEYDELGILRVHFTDKDVTSAEDGLIPSKITTAAEFMTAMTYPTGSYQLMNDIDLTGSGFVTVPEFSGSLDGNGHVLKGLGAQPLFSDFRGTLRNIVIDGTVNKANTEVKMDGFAVVCRNAYGAKFIDVVVKGYTLKHLKETQNSYNALFAMYAYDGTEFTRCETGVGCLVSQNGKANNFNGGFVGELLKLESGATLATFTDCTNNAQIVQQSSYNSNYCGGGFVANIICADFKVPKIFFTRCVNNGNVSMTQKSNVGGFVGQLQGVNDKLRSNHATFTDCVNNGTISATGVQSCIGGFIGRGTAAASVRFVRCLNRGEIAGTGSEFAGGFVGHFGGYMADINGARECTFINCANYGNVSANTAAGIIAKMNTNIGLASGIYRIDNCANYGTITGPTNAAPLGATFVCAHNGCGSDNCFGFSADPGIVTNTYEFVITGYQHTKDSLAALNAVADANPDYVGWLKDASGYPVLSIFADETIEGVPEEDPIKPDDPVDPPDDPVDPPEDPVDPPEDPVDPPVVAGAIYVSVDGNDSAAGTVDAPLLTVSNAVARLGQSGGTVIVGPGVYTIGDPIVITTPVAVIGSGVGDGATVIRNVDTYNSKNQNCRVMEISNAVACVSGLIVENGYTGIYSGNNGGGGIFLMAGTVSNCVVRGCATIQGSSAMPFGGGVYLSGPDSLLTHCVISNCTSRFDANWGSVCGAGVHVAGGRVSNTLIVDCRCNTAQPGFARIVGGVVLTEGTAENCTVVNCWGSKTGGIFANPASKKTVSVVNCVAYGCEKRIKDSNSVLQITTSNSDGTASCFANCAFDVTAAAFADYAKGDYTPATAALVDAGAAVVNGATVDLAGNTRVVGVAIDIGCYERQGSVAPVYEPPVIDCNNGGFSMSGNGLTLKIASPVQNAWYTLFTADTLTDTFKAVESVQYTGGEVPTFEIQTTGASKFATIGISSAEIPVNTPLK